MNTYYAMISLGSGYWHAEIHAGTDAAAITIAEDLAKSVGGQFYYFVSQ